MFGFKPVHQLYFFSAIALLLIAFLTWGQPGYTIAIVPALLAVLTLFTFSNSNAFLLVAFCTPFSVKMLFGDAGINVPNEPLMLFFLLLFIFKLVKDWEQLKPIIAHPLSLIVLLNLSWIFITSVTSVLPLISFKFLLARIWSVVFAFYWGAIVFAQTRNIKRFFMAYGAGLCLVIIYTTLNHASTGFSQAKSMLVMHPFMDDHTVYSAVCAMVLVFCAVILLRQYRNLSFLGFWFFVAICMLCLLGVALSYSRAAALSLVFVLGFYLLLRWRMSFKSLAGLVTIAVILTTVFSRQIYQEVKFNRAVSGKNLATDIRSISNVKTDESNVERINRWESGYRMFLEKPWLGFGPGTYMFTYSPYQKAHEMTSISTTHGNMGNMHSEYFGPLVESGVLGLLITLLLFFTFLRISMRIYYQSINRDIKTLCLAVLLAMVSYFFHGLLNNFLDQDKVAVLFWAMMGMVVALDLKETTRARNITISN